MAMLGTTSALMTVFLGVVVGAAAGPGLDANPSELPRGHTRSCQYEGLVYVEGQRVATEEPCLNCTCRRGSLVCYLRVCPTLPDPPPPNCVLLHRNHHCCPELVCADEEAAGESERRDTQPERTEYLADGKGCLTNGTLYAEGSAMASSSLCDYCYCIRGKQRCVQPRCLLPLPGCAPSYRALSCCPTHYNCSEAIAGATTTQTSTSVTAAVTGCEVDGELYQEGEMVQVVATSHCENCFCMKGKVQCVPLACSPPLQGCHPIILPGECCPSSYNCSISTIKNRAVEDSIINDAKVNLTASSESKGSSERENTQSKPEVSTLEEQKLSELIVRRPLLINTNQLFLNEGRSNREMTTVKNNTNTETYPETTAGTTMGKQDSTEKTETTPEIENTTSEIITTDNTNPTTTAVITTELSNTSQVTTLEPENILGNNTETEERVGVTKIEDEILAEIDNDTSIEPSDVTTDLDEIITMQTETTFMTLMPTTVIMPEVVNVVNVTLHKNVSIVEPDSSSSEAINESLTPARTIPPEIEAILNITNNKDEDYEYDYSEPSLPPSLPGVRIIPFVAADAVLEDKNAPTVYPKKEKHRPTDSPVFYKVSHPNLFSPPIETEGGFVPHGPILDGPFYESSKIDAPHHTTGIVAPVHVPLDITSGTIIPSTITLLPKTDDDYCVSNGHNYHHGELLSKPDACVMCLCYFGEVLCQATKCPPVKTGCRQLKDKEHGSCCSRIICADNSESPTVVLERSDATPHPQTLQQSAPHLGSIVPPITVADGVVTPDPFRDVIRTEPAPDLPSLIGDIMPYLLERHSSATIPVPKLTPSLPPSTLSLEQTTIPVDNSAGKENLPSDDDNDDDDDAEFSFGSVLQFLFSGDSTKTPIAATTTHHPSVTSKSNSEQQNAYNSEINSSSPKVTTVAASIEVTTIPLLDVFNFTLELDEPGTREKSDTLATSKPHANSVEQLPAGPGAASGLLKLAGCNIYGRMYRVGRIISELSGPCLECMCTEVGVQCRPLHC